MVLQLLFQLESKLIEVAALTKNSKKSPFNEKRRQIFYQNYAASITDQEWEEIEREEIERIRSMGKGKRSHLLIRANTKSSEDHATKFLSYYTKKEVSMQQIKSQLSVYEVLVNSGEIEHFYIASDSILSAMTAARNFGFIPISAKIMPEPRS